MAEIIEVNFRTGKKIQKYTVIKNICVVCSNIVVSDSRRNDNPEYITIEESKNRCVCFNCAILIKELVDENSWGK